MIWTCLPIAVSGNGRVRSKINLIQSCWKTGMREEKMAVSREVTDSSVTRYLSICVQHQRTKNILNEQLLGRHWAMGQSSCGAAGRDMTCTVRGMDPQSVAVSSEQFRHFENPVTLLWNLQAEEHFICHFLSQSFSVSPNYPSWQLAADSVITSVLLINFHPEIWEGFRIFFRYLTDLPGL